MMKKILRSPITTVILFLLAVSMLLTGTIIGVRAAPLLETAESYRARMELSDIAVQLTENGAVREGNDTLLTTLLGEGEKLMIGKAYDEVLGVRNNGDIDEYVRVIVTRYWEAEDGTKLSELDPELIELNFTDNGWVKDEENSTEERIILYYSEPLSPGDEVTFADKLTINGKVVASISESDENFDYDGINFRVGAQADGVQEHSAPAAIQAAWGVNVLNVSD